MREWTERKMVDDWAVRCESMNAGDRRDERVSEVHVTAPRPGGTALGASTLPPGKGSRSRTILPSTVPAGQVAALPRNLIWLLSTSIVAPSRRVSAASCDLKMMARIDVLPAPDLPIMSTCDGKSSQRGEGGGRAASWRHLFPGFGRHDTVAGPGGGLMGSARRRGDAVPFAGGLVPDVAPRSFRLAPNTSQHISANL